MTSDSDDVFNTIDKKWGSVVTEAVRLYHQDPQQVASLTTDEFNSFVYVDAMVHHATLSLIASLVNEDPVPRPKKSDEYHISASITKGGKKPNHLRIQLYRRDIYIPASLLDQVTLLLLIGPKTDLDYRFISHLPWMHPDIQNRLDSRTAKLINGTLELNNIRRQEPDTDTYDMGTLRPVKYIGMFELDRMAMMAGYRLNEVYLPFAERTLSAVGFRPNTIIEAVAYMKALPLIGRDHDKLQQLINMYRETDISEQINDHGDIEVNEELESLLSIF